MPCPDPAPPRAILLDIEGTTTPLSFVAETLFPYARRRGPDFIRAHAHDPEIRDALRDLQREAEPPIAPADTDRTIAFFQHLIDIDRKSTPLKGIQGHIWREGYAQGDLLSIVFDDVPPAFTRWRARGITLAIYSSGSVLAQQQLFAQTQHGDLTPSLAAYFDTTTGPKRDPDSYTTIAAALQLPPASILFLSDVTAELDTAHTAGLRTALALRPGNPPQPPNPYPAIHSFDELF